MSHFIGLVFGSDLDILERYDENRKVEPYVMRERADFLKEAWKALRESYLSQGVKIIRSDDEALRWYAKYTGLSLDKDGNATSTYNCEAKFDQYVVGGRWDKFLSLKNGTSANVASVGDVDWEKHTEKKAIPFCYVTPEGEWRQKGEMLYCGITKDEMPDEEWAKQFNEYVASLPSDTFVAAIDFHI